MIARPKREDYKDLVSFAHATAMYFEEVRHNALLDIRRIDSANNGRSKRFVSAPIATRETERERISVHEKAQNNPLLRAMLRKFELR